MTLTSLASSVIVWAADPTPTPVPEYTGDVNLITPGVLGFVAIFLIALATVLLILDMNRRVRRVRYRAEVREQLATESAKDADSAEDAESGGGKVSPAPEDQSPR